MGIARRIAAWVRRRNDAGFQAKRRVAQELARLGDLPRFRPTSTTVLGMPTRLVDAASFVSAYRQIIEQEIYRFDAAGKVPRILDCGANIGLAIYYWKRLYPTARILAFEADPVVFETLVSNCQKWGLADVETVNSAVWNSSGTVRFEREGADAGRVVGLVDSSPTETVKVPSIRLRDYLDEPIDLLKIDIEGAEAEVLLDCADHLASVERLFVEVHSYTDREQHIDRILSILRLAGFRIHIQPELVSPRPFVQRLNNVGMDQRLNVFAYR